MFSFIGQILEGKHLVRDIYAFKKGFPYPQLKLQVYKELDAYVKRQEQVSRSTYINLQYLKCLCNEISPRRFIVSV